MISEVSFIIELENEWSEPIEQIVSMFLNLKIDSILEWEQLNWVCEVHL